MKNFKFLFLYLGLFFAISAWSVDEAQLKKIQANLCADDSLNQVHTEAAAPCINCITNESNSSSPSSELKSVTKKVLTELEQNQVDQLEMEFFKYVEERGILSSGFYTPDSLPNMELQLKNYEETVKSMQTGLDSYKEKNSPETKKDLEESKLTGVIGPKTKETLKTYFTDSHKHHEKHVKIYLEDYDKAIASNKQLALKYPDQKAAYEKGIEGFEKAKAKLVESLESTKSILDWLEKSGKKEGLTSDKWTQVQSVLDFQTQMTANYSNLVPQYKTMIQNYQNEIVSLKAKIEVKKNVKHGEIHSPGFQKSDENQLLKYRKVAEQINVHHKSNPGYKACGMSEAEILALRWYTSSHYEWINKALRSGGEEAKKIEPYKRVLNNALEKLRAYDGEVRRGTTLPQSVDAAHQVGEIVDYQAYTSTSLASGWSGTHKFVIKSKTGRYVGSHSAHYGENEVLFAAGTKFKITARQGGEITMEEVGP